MAYVLMRCLLHRANATHFNKSYRRASNFTKLVSMQTLTSQSRSSGWLPQPELTGSDKNWRRLQFLESSLIQERKPELNASIPPMPLSIFTWIVAHSSIFPKRRPQIEIVSEQWPTLVLTQLVLLLRPVVRFKGFGFEVLESEMHCGFERAFFHYIFETKFFGHNKTWESTKKFGVHCLLLLSRS